MEATTIIQEIMPLLEKVAAKLEVGAATLWAMLLRQALVEGAWHFVLAAVLLALGIVVFAIAARFLAQATREYKDEHGADKDPYLDDQWAGTFISVQVLRGLGVGLFFGFGLVQVRLGLYALLNPGYQALLRLFEMVK